CTAAHRGGVTTFFKCGHGANNSDIREVAAHVVGEAGHVPLGHPQRGDPAFNHIHKVIGRVVIAAGGRASDAMLVNQVLEELERLNIFFTVEDQFAIGVIDTTPMHEHDATGRVGACNLD